MLLLTDHFIKKQIIANTINGREKEVVFYRKVKSDVSRLTNGEINHIVDKTVRKAIKSKIAELGSSKKINMDDPSTLPRMPSKKGLGPVIKKVRLWKPIPVESIGGGTNKRYVALENNHHIEIFAVLNKQGKTKKWAAKVVSLYEAMERKRQGRPIINRNHGPGTRFIFSFVKGDLFRAVIDNEKKVFQVRSFWTESNGRTRIRMREYNDARKNVSAKEQPQPGIDKLRKMRCQKITISPLGELYRCNA